MEWVLIAEVTRVAAVLHAKEMEARLELKSRSATTGAGADTEVAGSVDGAAGQAEAATATGGRAGPGRRAGRLSWRPPRTRVLSRFPVRPARPSPHQPGRGRAVAETTDGSRVRIDRFLEANE